MLFNSSWVFTMLRLGNGTRIPDARSLEELYNLQDCRVCAYFHVVCWTCHRNNDGSWSDFVISPIFKEELILKNE